MDIWKTNDVCAWLATIDDIEAQEIDLFKKAKIRGKALKTMMKDEMREYFPDLAIGDVLEILGERDKFLSQFYYRPSVAAAQDSPALPQSADGQTVNLHDLYPSATTEQNTKHPVRCTSEEPRFSLDMFERPKSVTEGPETTNVQARSPEQLSENEITLHASGDSVAKEKESPPQQTSIDSHETPMKQPHGEDLHNPLLKNLVEHDLQETPQEQIMVLTDLPLLEDAPVQDGHSTPPEPASANNLTDISQTKYSQENPVPDEHSLLSSDSITEVDQETPLKCLENSPPRIDQSRTEQREPSVIHCQKFNTEGSPKIYEKGSTISCQEGVQEGPVIFIHKFVDTESITTKKERVFFVKETVAFVSACLNDQYHGAIHFGITSRDERQDKSKDESSGTIKGVKFQYNWNEFKEEFEKALHKCFPPDQIDFALKCMGPLRRIQVVQVTNSAKQTEELFVIEVDVSPTSVLCAEEAFFVKLPSYEKKKLSYSQNSLFRCFDGNIRECSDEEVQIYMKNKHRMAEDRKRKEEENMQENLQQAELQKVVRMKLCDLMGKSGPDANVPVATYPVLVVNKPPTSMSQEDMQHNMSFLATVPFKVTFDFDESAKISEYIENVEKKPLNVISNADDFKETSDANIRSLDRLKSLQNDIKNSSTPSWIFTNGLREEQKNPYSWRRENLEGFRDAVRFFHQEIPHNRAKIVFLLLSEDQDVMIEAAQELITTFKDQWMVISETEELANTWAQELVRRNCIDENTWKDQSIVGVPFYEICEVVKGISGPEVKPCDPILVTSGGSYIPLKDSLPDLDVCSAQDNFDPAPPPKFEQQKEEEYYRGGRVDWWNFRYGHVLDRTKLRDLNKYIDSALRGGIDEDDQHLGRITLYHQAGAGGTSLAMRALWDHRKSDRCAVINTISDVKQTVEQILKLRQYQERGCPRPVLILLDNLEEEKTSFLIAELEEKAKQIARVHSQKSCVVCVLINCIRRNHLPKDRKSKEQKNIRNMVFLMQELIGPEKDLFKKKYSIMEKKHKKNLIGDPKNLISFNIMKENFDEHFMKRTVTDLLGDVKEQTERKLLKYVALLNRYDIQSQAIPTVAFDMMMTKTQDLWPSGLRYGKGAHKWRWESSLSNATQVLLNVTTEVSMGFTPALKIVSPLLSQYILDTLKKDVHTTQALSEMAIELFNTKDIFNFRSHARDQLIKIVQDVLKARAKGSKGLPEQFSPLIQEINNSEGVEKAGEVLERGFELTKDPFVAQQLARVFISASNWTKAKEFAETATTMKNDNSFLWDTYGRVYLAELVEYHISIVKSDKPLQPAECSELVKCAFKGMDIFKREQRLSLSEKSSMQNFAGYLGELDMIRCLLHCLSYVQAFHTKEDMKHFLVDPDYVVPEMCELDNEVDSACVRLKSLVECAKNAIARLEDEKLQLQEDHLDETKINKQKKRVKTLNELKAHIDPYFGEESDDAPGDLSEDEQCKYRRRRLFQLRATSMLRIFDLKHMEDGEAELNRAKNIVLHNINSQFVNADDLRILMCINMALIDLGPVYLRRIMFEDMVNMSQSLYEKRATVDFVYLEPYLFYVMFNWPRKVYHAQSLPGTVHEVRPTTKPINHKMFTDALQKWKDAYFDKYPKQHDDGKPSQKKDTTIFFFANGSGMGSIVSNASLRTRGTEVKGESFWHQPKVQRDLKRFEGTLCPDGDKVELVIEYPSRSKDSVNKDSIKVPTSFPIKNRQMLNKKVYFVIGFSWKGPKAFDVSPHDPTANPSYMVTDHMHDHGFVVRPKDPRPQAPADWLEPHVVFLEKLGQCTQKLRNIDVLKQRKWAGQHLTPYEVRRLACIFLQIVSL